MHDVRLLLSSPVVSPLPPWLLCLVSHAPRLMGRSPLSPTPTRILCPAAAACLRRCTLISLPPARPSRAVAVPPHCLPGHALLLPKGPSVPSDSPPLVTPTHRPLPRGSLSPPQTRLVM